MAWQVAWSRRAIADVEAIAEYIAADSPAYASAVVARILELTRNLSRFPRSGRKVPEFDDDAIREVFAYSYRVVYRLEAEHVVIAAVVHGKRMIE
jgi:plasmid stabilization system protein ParE